MKQELDALEARIRQVAELCRALHAENRALRDRLAASDADRAQLAARLDAARSRLAAVIENLPKDA
jgi:uncharacterized protein (TIGR02449 family)